MAIDTTRTLVREGRYACPDSFETRGQRIGSWPIEAGIVSLCLHLAAIVGFPFYQAIGEQVTWLYKVEALKQVFDLAERSGTEDFVLSSTYTDGIREVRDALHDRLILDATDSRYRNAQFIIQ